MVASEFYTKVAGKPLSNQLRSIAWIPKQASLMRSSATSRDRMVWPSHPMSSGCMSLRQEPLTPMNRGNTSFAIQLQPMDAAWDRVSSFTKSMSAGPTDFKSMSRGTSGAAPVMACM